MLSFCNLDDKRSAFNDTNILTQKATGSLFDRIVSSHSFHFSPLLFVPTKYIIGLNHKLFIKKILNSTCIRVICLLLILIVSTIKQTFSRVLYFFGVIYCSCLIIQSRNPQLINQALSNGFSFNQSMISILADLRLMNGQIFKLK